MQMEVAVERMRVLNPVREVSFSETRIGEEFSCSVKSGGRKGILVRDCK